MAHYTDQKFKFQRKISLGNIEIYQLYSYTYFRELVRPPFSHFSLNILGQGQPGYWHSSAESLVCQCIQTSKIPKMIPCEEWEQIKKMSNIILLLKECLFYLDLFVGTSFNYFNFTWLFYWDLMYCHCVNILNPHESQISP